MSQTTANYGFTKPELTDVPDITVLSQNWEMIDSILKSIDMRNKLTIVSEAADANSYATRGVYFLNNASSVPSEGKSGLLFVEPWSDSLATLQFWVERTTHEIYLRVKDYSWSAWSQISTHVYFEELRTEVQSTLSAFSGRIQDNYDYIDTVATALREQIGNTLVTDTISSSLDTSKSYVYVGTSTSTIDKGDWIYYDGTEWKSGGVYNSEGYQTDKTLTVADMAADAEVVGDEITRLDNSLELLANYYAIRTYLEWEEGKLDSDSGEDISNPDSQRSQGYIEKSKIINWRINSHTGALYVYRYSYDSTTGVYTYLGRNQRTNYGNYTNWLKTLDGTHFRFTVGAASPSPNDWMIIGMDTNLNKKFADIDKNTVNVSSVGYWYQEIVIEANSSHSATADILPVNIPTGTKFSIIFEVEPFYRPQIYAYYDDNTNERLYSASVSTYISHNILRIASKNIVGIGIFVSNSSQQRIYRQRIFVENSLADNFNYTKETASYIQLPEGKLCFKEGRDRVLVQSIAVINNEVWEFEEGKAYYNGIEYTLDNGHGNNCNWGKTLHGDYPYLYCPTWILNQMNINVFSFDGNEFTLVDTIHFNDYTGYLNAYIDEDAGFIYGFIFTNNPAGKCKYIVADINGTILSEKDLPYLIRTIQGMCMHNGILYVVSGYGNTESPNYLYKISPDGSLISKYIMSGIGEIEGIDFLDNKMVLASYYRFYINPILVPETEFYDYTNQLMITTP